VVTLSLHQVYNAEQKGHCALHSCEMSYANERAFLHNYSSPPRSLLRLPFKETALGVRNGKHQDDNFFLET